MKKYAFWLAAALSLLACLYAYFNLLLPLDVFLWDESHHGFYAMQIFDDLRLGDWGGFWEHTNNQALWMPLHSWLVGLFLWIFGFSYTTARCASLFLFFLSALLVYLISTELSEERGWSIGLIAVVLYLTSPALLHLAVLNMQEMLGMFICLISVYFMIRNSRHNAAWKYLVLGLLLGIAYWAKTNYAIVLAFGFGLFQLSALWGLKRPSPALPTENKKAAGKRRKEKKPPPAVNALQAWLMDNVYIVLGFLPLFVLWWATPPFERKYGLGITIRQGAVAGSGVAFLSGILPTAFLYLQSFVTSYNLSFWLALGCLFSLIISFRYFKDQNIRLLAIVFCANFTFLSLMSWTEERFLSQTVPLGFILFGYFSLDIYARYRQRFNNSLLLRFLLLLLALSFIYDLTQLTRFTKEMANRSISSFLYKESLNQYAPPFLFGLVPRPAFTCPTGTMLKDKKYPDFPATPRSNIRDVLDYFRSQIDRSRSISTMISYTELSPYVIYWHFHDWGAPVLSVNDLAYNQRLFWSADYFLALDTPKSSPYALDICNIDWPAAEKALLQGGYITLFEAKEFADLGLTAKIYKRVKQI
jgi:hypothetical protein